MPSNKKEGVGSMHPTNNHFCKEGVVAIHKYVLPLALFPRYYREDRL
jgi:hypothetical protein